MTDVFISYSRAHRDRIVPIAEGLRELLLDVWFDIELRAGDVFSETIEAHLKASRCVLVLWTKDALDKGARGWVRSEADWALQRDKLIQAQLEPVRLPPPFFSSVAPPIDLSASTNSNNWTTLLHAIAKFTKRPGLPHLPKAVRSDADLLAWSASYRFDPIAAADAPPTSRIAVRLEAARQAELERIRRRDNLESELRVLIDDTQRAPLPYFDASHRSISRIGNLKEDTIAELRFDPNVYGLEFYNLGVQRSMEGDTQVLTVGGEVRNIGRHAKVIPPVRVTLRDAQAHDLFELVNAITNDIVAPGVAIPFEIRIENPPPDAVDLEATFASPMEERPTQKDREPLALTQSVASAETSECNQARETEPRYTTV